MEWWPEAIYSTQGQAGMRPSPECCDGGRFAAKDRGRMVDIALALVDRSEVQLGGGGTGRIL